MAKKKAKSKVKRGRGQPRKYDTPEEMQTAIDEYFKRDDAKFTMCGLAIHLGFMDRQSLFDYGGYSESFSCTIKKARLRIEEYYEEHLMEDKKPTGAIFALKNMRWRDTQDITSAGERLKTVTIVHFGDSTDANP